MKIYLVCAALLAACTTAPAFAIEPDQALRAAIHHADLDLRRASDVARLDRRIRTAIAAVCGEPVDYDLAGANAIRRCRAEVRQSVAPRRARLIDPADVRQTLAAR